MDFETTILDILSLPTQTPRVNSESKLDGKTPLDIYYEMLGRGFRHPPTYKEIVSMLDDMYKVQRIIRLIGQRPVKKSYTGYTSYERIYSL